MSKEITLREKNTFISIGAVGILLSMTVTFVVYIVNIDGMATENRLRVGKLEEKRYEVDRRIFDQLNEIKAKLYKIEGYLDAKKE